MHGSFGAQSSLSFGFAAASSHRFVAVKTEPYDVAVKSEPHDDAQDYGISGGSASSFAVLATAVKLEDAGFAGAANGAVTITPDAQVADPRRQSLAADPRGQATDPRRRAAAVGASGVAVATAGGVAAANANGAPVSDPRLAAIHEREAKRARVTDPRLAAGSSPQGGATAPGTDLSARIFESLQRLRPSQASPQAGQEAALGTRLLDSLRTLMPVGTDAAGAFQGSQASQELFRVVQCMTPGQAAQHQLQQMHIQHQAAVVQIMQQPQQPLHPQSAAPVAVAPKRRRVPVERPPPRALPAPEEDDGSDEDDGVPHRLPPGFGAIPEDIVEERARMREELRIRQIKATQPCRFGKACKRRDCPNMHQEGRDIDTVLNLCSFGRKCKRRNCFYDHPEGREIDHDTSKAMCKWGARCKRPDCLYDHPPDREPVGGPDFRICFFCHDPGHIAQECPRNPDSYAYRMAQHQQAAQDGQKAIMA